MVCLRVGGALLIFCIVRLCCGSLRIWRTSTLIGYEGMYDIKDGEGQRR
jgi:hypothetical protein